MVDINTEWKYLIDTAELLKDIDYKSPKKDLWRRRAKESIKNTFGDEYVAIFEKALRWDRVVHPGEGPLMNRRTLDRAIDFLESLMHEPVPANPIKEPSTTEKTLTNKLSKIDNIIISGGDSNSW